MLIGDLEMILKRIINMQRFKHCRLSTIDYVLASPELFVKTHNLYVDIFD